jgi:hypothetical protein
MKTRLAILACLLFSVLGNCAAAENLSPTTWTQYLPHPCTNPQNAADGNPSTYSICFQVMGELGGGGEYWKGFPAGNPDPPAPTLNITSFGTVTGDGTLAAQYSLDGGSTWNNIFIVGSGFSKTTHTVNLSSSQDMTKVEVRAWAGLTGNGGSELDVYEIWISE